MSAASQARRRNPEIEVVVLERGATAWYEACGMPYSLASADRSMDEHVLGGADQIRGEGGLDLRLRHEVVAIELAEQQVVFREPDAGGDQRMTYDGLVLATGARVTQPSLAGAEPPGGHVLRTLEDGRSIDRRLAAGAQRAVILGGGPLGLEMAHVLTERGLAVTLLEKQGQVLPGWHEGTVGRVLEVLQENGVEVQTGVTVQAIEEAAGGESSVVVSDQGEHPADLVVLATGVRPNVELAAAAGLRLGDSGAIWVSQNQQTSDQAVWAAGDCAEAYHRILRRNVWLPLGTTANKQGRIAGANAAGSRLRFRGVVGTAGLGVFDLEVAHTGLPLEQARAEGFEPVAVTVRQRSRGHAYPGGQAIQMTLIADRPSGILLGGEIVGREGAALRINPLATALASHLTVVDLQNLDLVHAPPFAPVWDPLLVAANQLSNSLG